MTSETPQQDSGDDEVFAALMRQNWEREPTLRESMDPGILHVLEEVRAAEEALNSAADLSEATIQKVLLSLNEEWRILGLQRKTLAVTGKLRPTDVAIDEDVWEVTEEGAFPGLSSKDEDLRGDFTQASAFCAMMQEFDIEKLAVGEDDEVYRIVMQFLLDEDYNDENIWFTAYPEEIEYIEMYAPTPLRQLESGEGTVSQHEISPASEESRLEIVKEFESGLTELHKRLYEYVNPARRYPDEISLTAALNQVQNITTPFIERWKPVMISEPIPVEVMGSGLLIPNTEVQQTGDPAAELINYEIRGLDIQEADSFSTRRGLFIGIHITGGQVVDGEGYVMRAITVFRDIQQNDGVIIDDPYFHQPMMTIRVTRNFFANMADLDLEFTAIEADRIERRNRALESIASIDVPAHLRTRLDRQLRHLADEIDAEDGSSYMRYKHTDELNDMALAVSGNSEASHTLSYALQEIIGTPRSIEAGGAIIVGDDERDDSAIISGQLQGVISEHPWLKAPEPTLLVSVAASDDSPERFYLVPLSTIEYLEY